MTSPLPSVSDDVQSASERVETISPRVGWFDVDIVGTWRYRDLIWLFIRRDFVAVYKQTILGPIWFLVQPLANSVVFAVIFGHVAKLPTDGLPPFLFYLAAVVPWSYFSNCVMGTSNVFAANVSLFGKVYFPRLVVPMSVVLSNLTAFAIQFCSLLGFLAYYMLTGADVKPTWLVLLTPVLLLQMAALGLGVGLTVSALTTRYRDLTFAIGFGVSLWMYATPIVYPFSRVPDSLKWLFALNPMTGVVELFRMAYLGAGSLTIEHYMVSLAVTAVALAVGVVAFARFEKSFIDTI